VANSLGLRGVNSPGRQSRSRPVGLQAASPGGDPGRHRARAHGRVPYEWEERSSSPHVPLSRWRVAHGRAATRGSYASRPTVSAPPAPRPAHPPPRATVFSPRMGRSRSIEDAQAGPGHGRWNVGMWRWQGVGASTDAGCRRARWRGARRRASLWPVSMGYIRAIGE
jgi:hypothetical protein